MKTIDELNLYAMTEMGKARRRFDRALLRTAISVLIIGSAVVAFIWAHPVG